MIAVILCGGAGSRLWPVSRLMYPKQFLRLPDGQSFIQKAFLRAINIEGVTEVVFVTNKELLYLVESEVAELCIKNTKVTYILEPFMRNTAPAIACALCYMADDSVSVLVLTADHRIADEAEFRKAVKAAQVFVNDDKIVTFGVVPTSPETGYGYIETDGNNVLRFVEKPTAEKANQYIAAGNYFWNAGMFAFKTGSMLNELKQFAPDIPRDAFSALLPPIPGRLGSKVIHIDPEIFEGMPNISIDYAVLEKSANLKVTPCNMGWQDIGSWESYGNLYESDENGNRLKGESVLRDVKDCIVHMEDNNKLVAALGLSGIIIADTKDAILVADRNRAQEVKDVFHELKKSGHEAHNLHSTQYRPWGEFTLLQTGDNFKIKHIRVYAGEAMSLQLHHHRSEHWVIVKGVAKVTNNGEYFKLNRNESIYISAGHKHRIENPGNMDLELIEVQCGDYLEEDDIVRFEDRYGRS
jgi:mannose-1-phosphate guanylyltransferase